MVKLLGLLAATALVVVLSNMIAGTALIWQVLWGLAVFYMGRGFPDVTRMTADSWGGLWGYLTSPFLTIALIIAGLYSHNVYFVQLGVIHFAGFVWIRVIWAWMIRK